MRTRRTPGQIAADYEARAARQREIAVRRAERTKAKRTKILDTACEALARVVPYIPDGDQRIEMLAGARRIIIELKEDIDGHPQA